MKVHQDEHVLFWWSNLCDNTDLDNESSKALKVVFRGFAFAARWMKVFQKGSKDNLEVR